MSNFERIPPEIFHLILDQLPVADLFSCKCVCKKWLSLVAGHFVSSLVVSGSGLPLSERSFDACQKVNPLNVVQRQDLLVGQLSEPMFFNLRQFYVYNSKIETSFVSKVNCLRSLEMLEIYRLELTCNCTLNLPKLSRLHLNVLRPEQATTIRLDCPQLKELKINQISLAQLLYPDRLVIVHVLNCDQQLKELTNLKKLSISALTQNDLENDFLAKLDRLEQLLFEGEAAVYRALKRQMEIYERTIRVYHFGVCQKPRDLVINYDHCLTETRVQFYTNRQLAATLPAINCVMFDERLFDRLPEGFIGRLSGVRTVKVVEEIYDERKLAVFIEGCGNLLKLHLFFSKFSANFFSSLPRLTPFLVELNFDHYGSDLNYEFVDKLRFLRELTTANRLTLSQLKALLNHPNLLRQLEFCYMLQSQTIKRTIVHLKIVKIVHKSSRFTHRLEVLWPATFTPCKFTSASGLLSFIEKRLAEKLFSTSTSSLEVQEVANQRHHFDRQVTF